MSSSTTLPGKGAMYEDQYARTWFVAAGDDVPDEWTKVRESKPLPGEQLDPNNIDGTAGRAVVESTANELLLDRLAELEARLEAVEPADGGADAGPGGDVKTTATGAKSTQGAKPNPQVKS